MAKKKTAARRGPIRATLVKKRGGGSVLVLRRNAAAAPAKKPRKGSKAYKAQRAAAMRSIADGSRAVAAELSKASRRDESRRKARVTVESKYAARAKATRQYATRTKKTKKKVRVRVAYGAFKRAGSTYGYVTAKGKVRKIPEWAILGAKSKRDAADSKYDKRRTGLATKRRAAARKVASRFTRTTKKLERQVKALQNKQLRELKKIAEGKSIMAPNRRKRSRKKGKRRGYKRKASTTKRRGGKRKLRANGRRTLRSNKRRAGKRRSSIKRTVYRGKRSRTTYRAAGTRRKVKRKSTRGRIVIAHTRVVGGKRKTRRTTFRYKARVGRKGYVSVRLPTRRGKAKHYNFTANKRRSVRRRKSFRRNGAFDPIMNALKTGAPVLGGFALHRVATGLLASAVGPSLGFLPEAAKVPVVGLLVAALGAIGIKAVVKGEAGNLALAGVGASFLHQAVMAALRYAGQDGAASMLGGIPTVRTTRYGMAGMGAYELVGNGVSGFGAFPYSQAAAGYGALPYSQALAGANPFAARGNYLDVPSLGAYPEQAMAGGGDFPTQAAAGIGGGQMGAYELTDQGGTFNGIGTDDRSIERALDIADKTGSVGFGADTVGRSSILNPDGAESPIGSGGELPMVAGIFGASSLSVPFG